MPLVVVPHEGRYRVTVICDHCHEPITDASKANYEWLAGDGRAPLLFVHKACVQSFERKNGQRVAYCWEDLDMLPLYLATNTGIAVNVGNPNDSIEADYSIHVHPAGYEL